MATDMQKQGQTKLSWAATSTISGGSNNDYQDGMANEMGMNGHNTTSHNSHSKNKLKINYNVLTDLEKLRTCLQQVELMSKKLIPLKVVENLLKILKLTCSCDVV